jgi:hypothetical protein
MPGTIFDDLDNQQPTQTTAPPAPTGGTVFDELPAPASAAQTAPEKTVFDDLKSEPEPKHPTTQPESQPNGIVARAWQWANEPLISPERFHDALSVGGVVPAQSTQDKMDAAAAAAPGSKLKTAYTTLRGVQTGTESFLDQLTSPVSLGLAVASMGGSVVEQGLVKAGVPAVKAAGLIQKVKLGADLGFLTKYGADLGANTVPQLELTWGDYRAATNDRDRTKALEKLTQLATDTVLNGAASLLAVKGVARDVHEITTTSPKGQAMTHTDYANGVHNFQEENQVGTSQASQDRNEYEKLIPKMDRRVAITRNIEAGGDPNVLEAQARAAELNPLTKDTAKEFRDAKQLSPTEQMVRDEMKNKLNADLAHLKALNLLPEDGGLTNYFPHRWDVEDLDPDTGKPLVKSLLDGDRDMLKKRKFASIAEGEAKGLKPTTKDAIALWSDYHERVSNLIAKHNLAEGLASGRVNTGAPMGAPGHLFPGYTRPMDAPADDVEVAKLKSNGQFDGLIKSGRLYEVPGTPAKTMYATPKENVEAAGGVFRGARGGLVEATLPEQLTKALPMDERMKKFVSVTLPEDKVSPEAVRDAMVKKVGEMGGDQAQAAQFLKATIAEKPKYMWKQSDYVPSGLSVWRPIRDAEVPAQPNAIVTWGNGPVPENAIMPRGAGGIPSDKPATEKIPNARVPVYVAPEVAPHLEPMLESTVPKNALIRHTLEASKEAKSDLLSLSPFHWVTIMDRMLESSFDVAHPIQSAQTIGRNLKAVAVPPPIDYYNLTPSQTAAIHNGVVVGSTRPGFSKYLEGVGAENDSFINKIPLVGQFNRAIEEHLFGPHGWISALKFDLYDRRVAQLKTARPALSDEQVGRIAASQVNNKFGGLNYTVMGRGASTQNTLRLLLLAPDFLESSGRSVLDVAGEHGGGLSKSLVAFNVAQWGFARALNYLVSGDTHPEAGFSVKSKDGKKEYSLRTTLGDYLHFITKPRDFLANRTNPLARATDEIFGGEDNLGHKVTNAQKFFDTLRTFTPIPLGGLYPKQQLTQEGAIDTALQGVGVGARKYFTPAETLAQQLETKHTGEGAPLEGDELASSQLRYKLEDQLREAITQHDTNARIKVLQAIHADSSGDDPKISPEEAKRIKETAHKYPMRLQSSVDRLPLADALQVWDKAGLAERKAIRPILREKIKTWDMDSSKHTREQNDSMRQRIQAFRYSLVE